MIASSFNAIMNVKLMLICCMLHAGVNWIVRTRVERWVAQRRVSKFAVHLALRAHECHASYANALPERHPHGYVVQGLPRTTGVEPE